MFDADKDKNERFILRKSAQFLHRHLSRYPSYSKEAVKMLCWNLGKHNAVINQFMISHLSDRQRNAFEKELSENAYDFEDYVHLIYRKISRLKKADMKKLQLLVLDHLEKIAGKAGYRGKADFEKNVAALKRMFGLSDHEEEFVIFLFLLSINEAAQEYFVGDLGCNKIMGRKYLANVLGIGKPDLIKILSGMLKKIEFVEMDGYDLKVEDKFLDLFQNPSDHNFSAEFYTKIYPGNCLPLHYFLVKDDEMHHLLSLLKKKPQTASHILLYGPPGTGKTVLAYHPVRCRYRYR